MRCAGWVCTVFFLAATPGWAADVPVGSPQLQKCLKRADELPDMAAAEAQIWIKRTNETEAHLCRAFAQSRRGMHQDAGREFWYLASLYDKRDTARAVTMHVLAGQEFVRAKDAANAAPQFAAVLKIMPDNVDALTGRAMCRMQSDAYWEAVDDLNRALHIDPGNVEALRQRGRAWMHLGNDRAAQEDLAHAQEAEGPGGGK